MDIRKIFSTALLFFCSVALCFWPARATTLSSNLSETVSATEFVGDDTWITASFATDSAAYLLSNAVLLLSGSSDATAKLYLYSNSNGQPGLSLGQLQQASSLTSELTLTSFSGNNLALAANSIYWLVLQTPAGAIEWGWTGSSSGTGVGFQHTWGATDDAGANWIVFARDPMISSVAADPANAAVPEPSGVLLFATNLVLLGSQFFQQRRANAA